MLVFDSNSLIALLRQESGADVIETLLTSPLNCFIHAINVAEIFYDISRGTDVSTARATIAKFVEGGLIERPDLDAAFREDVAQLKSDWRRVSLADCCGLALARRLDAEFVTADHHELDVLDAAHVCRFRFFR